MLKADWIKHTLEFKIPAGTSRGILHTKDSYFLRVWDTNNPETKGIGECSILPNLSPEASLDLPAIMDDLCENITNYTQFVLEQSRQMPAVNFALETALRDLEQGGNKLLYQSKFSAGLNPIPINGLVWMGDYDFMRQQLKDKLRQGFSCIKLKIGAINFDEELALLKQIRDEFSPDQIEIRVDANGAFAPDEAMNKLRALSQFTIHSIEQPIAINQWDKMRALCEKSSIPIALDEELIPRFSVKEKKQMLEDIQPQYIILKPSLIGGYRGTMEWIHLAQSNNIKWWATSALESNIGLNAIAQWIATFNTDLPQGLGTGALFTNNIESPLEVSEGTLHYRLAKNWDLSNLNFLE
jgi:o-succinylbenzoate synthase